MDPLAPTTDTLGPAISHIAETAATLSSSMQTLQAKPAGLGISVRVQQDTAEQEAALTTRRQRDTVKWVLDTPRRLRQLIDQERDEEAEQDWEEVSNILDKWQGVSGAKELREECEGIMQEEEDSD
jgi:hypothetical protein